MTIIRSTSMQPNSLHPQWAGMTAEEVRAIKDAQKPKVTINSFSLQFCQSMELALDMHCTRRTLVSCADVLITLRFVLCDDITSCFTHPHSLPHPPQSLVRRVREFLGLRKAKSATDSAPKPASGDGAAAGAGGDGGEGGGEGRGGGDEGKSDRGSEGVDEWEGLSPEEIDAKAKQGGARGAGVGVKG